jgi:hypothetical protein
MTNQMNAILINKADNVATAIVELFKGERAQFWTCGEIIEILITEKIPK